MLSAFDEGPDSQYKYEYCTFTIGLYVLLRFIYFSKVEHAEYLPYGSFAV